MAMLIAVTTSVLGQWRRWSGYAVAPLLLVALFEAPIRWYLPDPEAPAVYRWLASQPADVVAELPINHVGSEYRYLLRATHHHKRIVNGVSGFTPPLTVRLTAMSKSDPIPVAFTDQLRAIGTDLVIVHADQLGDYSPATREWLRRELEAGRLRFARRFDHGIGGDWVFAFGRGGAIAPELSAFLAGRWTKNDDTFGLMQPPPQVLRGAATFSGWALSPRGIRKVDLLFENGAVRVPATLHENRRIAEGMPWYPKTERPWFTVTLASRPPGVRMKTDVQAEVTDGIGKVTRLEHLWFEWY